MQGLRLGHHFIQAAKEHLAAQHSSLHTFATLSPIPSLTKWIEHHHGSGETAVDTAILDLIAPSLSSESTAADAIRQVLVRLQGMERSPCPRQVAQAEEAARALEACKSTSEAVYRLLVGIIRLPDPQDPEQAHHDRATSSQARPICDYTSACCHAGDPGTKRYTWHKYSELKDVVGQATERLARQYLEPEADGKIHCPVSRFHRGNGATLHRINPLGNLKQSGLTASGGCMVNYMYDCPK